MVGVFCFHSLWPAFGNWLVQSGVSLYEVQKLLVIPTSRSLRCILIYSRKVYIRRSTG